MTQEREDRRARYCASDGRNILVVCHRPRGIQTDMGCVVCQPIGSEYYAYHKAALHIVENLTRAGIPCIRFDYSGCGDSEGGAEHHRLSVWQRDVVNVAKVLRDDTGIMRLCLCGVGFGGTLALMHRDDMITGAAVWNPIIDGKAYVKKVKAAHRNWLTGSFAKTRRGDRFRQRLGFVSSDYLEHDLKEIDLLNTDAVSSERVLMLYDGGGQPTTQLAAQLKGLGVNVMERALAGESATICGIREMVRWIRALA